MELWIRSQNKKRLIKANEIYLDNIYYDDGTVDILVNEFIFGRYVEERALEVLDEIQEMLVIDLNITGTYQENDLSIKSNILGNMVKVFIMPEE